LTTISGDTYLADSSTLSSTDLATALATSTNRGWFYTFATSEKVINAPLSLGGVAYFSTNTPTANNSTSCNGSLGTAKGYQFSFLTGSLSSSVTFDSGGLPPSPITGLVSLTDQGTGQTVLVQVVVGAGGGDTSGVHSASGGGLHSALEGADKNVTPPSTKAKNYWYNKYDQSAQ
jgi:type IV pilus assembly protein PilY1